MGDTARNATHVRFFARVTGREHLQDRPDGWAMMCGLCKSTMRNCSQRMRTLSVHSAAPRKGVKKEVALTF
jgi:hypothetical protein